jgi:hypothetical protein
MRLTISAIKSLRQYLKGRSDQFLRFFADLAIKLRMAVRMHATLKCLRGVGSIKETCRNAQGSDPVTRGPGGANLVRLATHVIIPAP